jgi:predicted permease
MTVSWLDVKLGLRMFAKHPGLSLVTVVGMAVAIAIGAGYFGAIGTMFLSNLPFDEKGRVVVIRTQTVPGPGAGNTTASMHDLERWRDELQSIVDLGAFREESRNLISAGGQAYLVQVAYMTASGFPFTGVAPTLGRTLLADDERASSPPVLVIGHQEWQRRFNGDPAVIGQVVRLEETPHTIVGVMPDGFGFPVGHRYWVPLRLTPADQTAAPPPVLVFGRLAAGFSLADARSELAAVGERMAAAFPQTHKDVRPYVHPYTHIFMRMEGPEAELAFRGIQFGLGLLLVVVAVNVSILVYARTATRTGEIAVRTALGASRARVVALLFVEALVPALTAAAIGLSIVSVGYRMTRAYVVSSAFPLPYWIPPESFRVSFGVIVYTAALALIAAAIIGVLPGLKATGKRVQARLQQFSARGAGLQLGRTWTALIVLQVAVAVTALPAAVHHAEEAYRLGMRGPATAAAPLLRATLAMSRDAARAGDAAAGAQDTAFFTARMNDWIQRLEAEPGVSAVTYSERFMGFEERTATLEGEAPQSIAVSGRTNRVATNLFDVLGVRVLAGRGFTASDANPGATAVIVDQAFAERLDAGGNVLGRRICYTRRSAGSVSRSRWYEIVGVVPAFADTIGAPAAAGGSGPRVYHAARPGDHRPATVIIQVNGGDPARFADRLRAITASVHPALKLEQLRGVVHAFGEYREAFWYISVGILAVTASVLLLSAAGIYAMMSFTVAKRRREIGIRVALGADARRLLMGIFGRASAQIGAGVACGLAVATALERLTPGGVMGGRGQLLLPFVACVMFTIGVLAALGPARRGLAVQPIEALRDE